MPYILIGFIILTVLALVKSKKAASMNSSASEAFWEKENKANTTRKKELTDLDYILFDYKNLPIIENNDTGIVRYLSVLSELSNSKILNLHGKTNTDLKLEYGYNNLQYLMNCEGNYIKLIQVLHQLGKRLQVLELTTEATAVFELEVFYSSDISETYRTLALIYSNRGDTSKITELSNKVSTLNSIKKDKIIEILNSYL
ncbi:MAG: hypothetical protein K0R15_1992 [Clostridiales bacterium]|jgi:hypothetical protein|nr:hypothetical protein [Clostridiales bacterium]